MLRSSFVSTITARSSSAAAFCAAAPTLHTAARRCSTSAPKPAEPTPSADPQPSARATASSSSSSSSFSWRLPPGIEIYSGCVFLIAGWWYWLEAHYRRVDRQCEALRTSATERTTKLAGIVSTTSEKWQQDVKGKEEMLLKVQRENARLAQLLDRVSLFLRRCNVPVS